MSTRMGKESDVQLRPGIWDRFVSGEVCCFEQLFRKYYKQMYGYGLKLCGQPELVEDCIQELFQTIWERRDELTHIDSANVYLYVSLRRKILKKRRQRSRAEEKAKEADRSLEMHFSMEEIIVRRDAKKQQKEALWQALNQLSNRQKEVIYLHYYNGMSFGEIEQILSINRQSVHNHMYRAMQVLRSILDSKVMRIVTTILMILL